LSLSTSQEASQTSLERINLDKNSAVFIERLSLYKIQTIFNSKQGQGMYELLQWNFDLLIIHKRLAMVKTSGKHILLVLNRRKSHSNSPNQPNTGTSILSKYKLFINFR